MKDYSSLAKLGRDAGSQPVPIYLNTILNKYDEILYSILKERQRRNEQKETTNIGNITNTFDKVNRVGRNEDIHELY